MIKIDIEVDGKTYKLTVAEAKRLYEELGELFYKKEDTFFPTIPTIPTIPRIPDYPTMPRDPFPTNPTNPFPWTQPYIG